MDSQDDEQAQKSAYINEHIIGKGYNPDDLSNFIIRKRGVKIDELPFSILKKSIEQFKSEQLAITYSSTSTKEKEKDDKQKDQKDQSHSAQSKPQAPPKDKKKEAKEEKLELFDIVYSPVTYEIKCTPQEENPLKLLKEIKIIVSDPQTVQSKSFFSKLKSVTTYCISCREINSSVRRSMDDIEWLRNKFINIYPYRLIPPIYKPTIFQILDKDKETETVIYLNKFFEGISQRKILRTSMVLYSFLTLPDDKFTEMKDKKNNYTLKSDLTNLINYNGNMNFALNKQKAIYVNAMSRLLEPTILIYEKITNCFNNIVNDYGNLSKHYKELHSFITAAADNGRHIKNCEHMNQYYRSLAEQIQKLSTTFEETKNILNEKIKDNFNYCRLEYINLDGLSIIFDTFREQYETFAIRLKKNKENLIASQNITKMDLDGDDLKNYNEIAKDKKVLMEKILPKETKTAEELKKKMVLIMCFIESEHEKLMRHQDLRLTEFSREFKKQYEAISKEQTNILELISQIS